MGYLSAPFPRIAPRSGLVLCLFWEMRGDVAASTIPCGMPGFPGAGRYRGWVVSPPRFQPVTVEHAVREYLRDIERAVTGGSLSPRTAATYRRDLEEFAVLAGADTVLNSLTPRDLDDIVLAYSAQPDRRFSKRPKPPPHPGEQPVGRGPSTTARFRQSISRLFSASLRAGFLEANPFPDTRVRPRSTGLISSARKAPTLETVEALLEVTHEALPSRKDRVMLPQRDTAILRLLLEVGVRVSELCALDRSDLRIREQVPWLLIRHGKGGKERDVPLSQGTYEVIGEWLELPRPVPPASTSEWDVEDAYRALFVSYRGRRLRPRNVQDMIARYARQLPPELRRHITPHSLRHAAATILLSSGAADARLVQTLLGHANLATTGVYLDVTDTAVADAVARHPLARGSKPRAQQ